MAFAYLLHLMSAALMVIALFKEDPITCIKAELAAIVVVLWALFFIQIDEGRNVNTKKD